MAQSRGVSSKGSKVQVQSGLGPAKTITAIAKANPAVVTSTAHGFLTGDVILFSTIGGMIELEAREYLVIRIDANSFSVVGVDSTAYTTYTSGGIAKARAFFDICEMKSFTPSDPGSAQIEKTTVCSDAKEFVAGLADEGTASLDFNWVPDDAALTIMWDARDAGSEIAFRVRHTQFTPVAYQYFRGTVNRLPRLGSIGTNTMLAGSGEIKISGKVYQTTVA
jgi:Ubiquitin-activating enzyme E1 FCCH domain/Lambda phage tail tube protein, TTP